MKYLDTSILIAAYIPHDKNHQVAENFIADLVKQEEKFIVSIFTLAELAGYFSRNHSPDKSSEVIQALLKLENIVIMYFENTQDFQNSLLATCTETGLSGADAIHYLQTISNNQADELVTLDKDFKRVASKIKVRIL
jgi:predicted nucleic acid-binding protein